jgi:hypothetical protein
MPSTALPPLALRVSNVVNYVLLVVVNTLANQGLFGPNNADVSKQYQTPLTPAGWAFSIWGVIFALQGAGVIYAALPRGYTDDGWKAAVVNAIGYGWQLTWLFECSWLVSFPQQTLIAFIACAVFLFAALFCIGGVLGQLYTLTNTSSTRIVGGTIRRRDRMSPFLFALYVVPTSMNTAWLSVASCLGITVLAASQAMQTVHQNLLAAVLATVVTLLGLWVLLKHRDVVYGLTVIWALSAVLQAQQHVELMQRLSIVAIVVLGLSCGYVVVRRLKQSRGSAASAAMQESLLGTAAAGGNQSATV